MNAATRLLAAGMLAAIWAGPVQAGPSYWNISPLKLDLGDGWTAQLGGSANLTGYTTHQSGGLDRVGVTGSALFFPRVEKLFSNGWRVGIRSTILAYHDELSGDLYGNDVFQKAYLFVQMPFGRIELGQQDGAAYKMSVTGPLVADDVALDAADITFFRDPVTHEALGGMFKVNSAVFASANATKLSYYSPRLFGLRLGLSYTPHLAKDVLPFVSSDPRRPDRQDNIVEGALNYTGFFGRTALGAYAGFAVGHNAQRTPGHDDLFDWGVGGEIDCDLGGATLAAGGAWRQSNGYAFKTGQAFRTGTTHAVHVSTKLTTGPWLFGLEYLRGGADAEAAMPQLAITGYQADIGYVINSNLQLTGGWQHQRFTRSSGVFYNGARALELNGGFLYLRVHV